MNYIEGMWMKMKQQEHSVYPSSFFSHEGLQYVKENFYVSQENIYAYRNCCRNARTGNKGRPRIWTYFSYIDGERG